MSNTLNESFSRLSTMNGTTTVADLAKMTTEERMAGMEHSEVRYFTSYDHHGKRVEFPH